MLSLGTSTAKVEAVTFVNGSGAVRAALRRECAQRSRDTCLVAERRALPRAGPDASPGNYGDVLSGILSPDFTTVCDLWIPHAHQNSSWTILLCCPCTPRARIETAKAIASINLGNSPDCCRLKHD